MVRRTYDTPTDPLTDGLSRVATALHKAGRAERAVDLLREDYRSDRQTVGWTVQLVGWLLDARRTDEAATVIASVAPRALPSDWHCYTYAVSLARLGRLSEAEVLMGEVYARNTDVQDGFSGIGWEHKTRGDLSRALELLGTDYDARRQSPGWQVNFVSALLDGDRADEALNVLTGISVEALASDHARTAFFGSLLRLGQFDAAESLVRHTYGDPAST
ncbi:MAG: tetratricopeptide repeat protein, partial [Actinomycetes bacterium]